MSRYFYKKALTGIEDDWHRIIIPDDVYAKADPDLSDLRIFGFTEDGDTIEAPYILERKKEKTITENSSFILLNTSKNATGFYYTFKLPEATQINNLKLDFSRKNFDWKVTLEGSHDQKEWFTLLEDSRMVSVQNDFTDFTFSTLSFPSANYMYYRTQIKTNSDPELTGTFISSKKIIPGDYRHYKVSKTDVLRNHTDNTTEIRIDLAEKVPVSYLKIPVSDTFDCYRKITIKYIHDSTKTDKGWHYNYRNLTSGTLQSVHGTNEFVFPGTPVKKLKVVIYDQDNEPLSFKIPEVKGYQHELITRFTKPATYFLYYGNKEAIKPNYDIRQFTRQIPEVLISLRLEEEQLIDKELAKTNTRLFENKAWLWLIMFLVVAIVGWFTFKMLKKV